MNREEFESRYEIGNGVLIYLIRIIDAQFGTSYDFLTGQYDSEVAEEDCFSLAQINASIRDGKLRVDNEEIGQVFYANVIHAGRLERVGGASMVSGILEEALKYHISEHEGRER